MDNFAARDNSRIVDDAPEKLLDFVSEAMVSCTSEGLVAHWNKAAERLFGFAQSEVVGLHVFQALPELKTIIAQIPDNQPVSADGFVEVETQIAHRNGAVLDIALKMLVGADAEDRGQLILARDISRRKKASEDRERLIECARLVGKPFLEEAVRVLSLSLKVRWVVLCEIDRQRTNMVRTLAFWADGERRDDFEYDLTGTPCYQVASGETCFIRENVQGQFPQDEKLALFDAESYLGVPLLSREGMLLGVLAVFHDRAIDERLEPALTLELFAGRAAAEIERLRTSSWAERLGRIVEDSVSEAFVFDAETLKFVLVNRGARENLGYSMDELSDLTPIDIKPAIAPNAFHELIAPLKSGETQLLTFETIHRRKDGSNYNVSVKLQLLQDEDRAVFYAAIEDVTDRNATMQALQDVTSRLDTILSNTTMAMFLMNERQQCVYMNGAAERLTGYGFDEVQGRILHDVIHHSYPDGRPFPLSECAIDRALPEDNHVQGEEVFVHKDGSFYPVAFTASPIRDIGGTATGTVIEAKNITDEIAAREALENFNAELNSRIETALAERDEVEAQLRHAQKMDAVGKLTGGVAHDFNNLLQIIGGNLELLKRDLNGNLRAERCLEMASAGVHRGAKLAQQLLAFGRKQALAPKVCDVGRLVRGLDDMIRRTLGERIDLETIVNEDLWKAFVDEGQVENAILNLAINARDAMSEQGKLTVEVANKDIDEFYVRRHPDMEAGQYIMVSVTDTGCGMSPEIQERIFEPFFTTKEVGKGTGLGLSMVYGLVKQSGGQLTVYSEPGHGTTIRMYLPRSINEHMPIEERVTGGIVGGVEVVLVVEDDDDVRSTVTALLKELGYTVLSAENADAGLAIIESGIKIDLLFSDVIMPGKVQSHEMAKRAQQLIPGIAVLFTSGYTENSIVHNGRLDEGVELLSKPYNKAALARKLRECLDNANNDNHLEVDSSKDENPPISKTRFRVLFVEDEALIRLAGLEMLGELGHEAKGTATVAGALELLANEDFDVLIMDLGLPDASGQELAAKVGMQWPHIKIIFATGSDENDVTLGALAKENVHWLTKPYSISQLEDVLRFEGPSQPS